MAKSPDKSRVVNGLSVDVEEYFHPSEIQASGIGAEHWDEFPSRIEGQVRRTLDLFAQRDVKATFFVLGWVAEKHPRTVREIAAAGHEIGCHSYSHQLVYDLSVEEFREDTLRATDAIQDACGVRPRIYRAPSYSITSRSLWALEVLIECGFTHDSSIYPIRHDRYGIPGFSRHPLNITTPSGVIREIPVGTVLLSRTRVSPVGGGGYLRMLPYRYTAAGIRRVNEIEGCPVCVYTHPWELDTQQPRFRMGAVASLRTYLGLGSMAGKLARLLNDFDFAPLTSLCSEPLGEAAPLHQDAASALV